MIRSHNPDDTGLDHVEGLSPKAMWIDLVSPTETERAEVETLLGRPLPSLEDQEEIQHSSRLFHEGGTSVLTTLLLVDTEVGRAKTAPVTFILTPERLVTIRHHAHNAFETYRRFPGHGTLGLGTPARILIGLLEAIVDRMADITEQTGREVEELIRNAFDNGPHRPPKDHTEALRAIGWRDTEVMILRESLLSLERLLGFLQSVLDDEKKNAHRSALQSCQTDVRTIVEQANFLAQKTSLLLDATLGMVEIEQNDIAKIFSIVATVFLPPTLIASFWGMNFTWMPLLHSEVGFWGTVAVMVASAVLPVLWFKHKGWL